MFLERCQGAFHILTIVIEVWRDPDIAIAAGGDDLLAFEGGHMCVFIGGGDCEHGAVEVGCRWSNYLAAHSFDACA